MKAWEKQQDSIKAAKKAGLSKKKAEDKAKDDKAKKGMYNNLVSKICDLAIRLSINLYPVSFASRSPLIACSAKFSTARDSKTFFYCRVQTSSSRKGRVRKARRMSRMRSSPTLSSGPRSTGYAFNAHLHFACGRV
jgi:hypothetical protein